MPPRTGASPIAKLAYFMAFSKSLIQREHRLSKKYGNYAIIYMYMYTCIHDTTIASFRVSSLLLFDLLYRKHYFSTHIYHRFVQS
jgi:hypothetical protein